MAKRQTSGKRAEPKVRRTPGESKLPAKRSRGTPPEMSNRDHPGARGSRKAAAGEGIISAGTQVEAGHGNVDAGNGPDSADARPPRSIPRRTRSSPGARTPGTTINAPGATPAHSGGAESSTSQASEAMVDDDSTASLRVPSNLAGPTGSAGPAADETADPNYTAASRPRASDAGDAGVTRMATGRSAARSPRIPEGRDRTPRAGGRARFVREVMTADVAVANPDTELYYVARMMAEKDIGIVPVVEDTDSMRPVGTVTDRDIVVRAIARNQDPKDVRAGQVMTSEVLTVRDDAPLDEALRLMEDRKVRRVLVVDARGRCCGIVSQGDVALHAPPHETGELVQEVSEPTGGGQT